MGKKAVILVHGISTKGEWEKRIAPVLKPFFQIVPVYYSQFKHLGALKVVAEPGWLVAATVVAAWNCWFYENSLWVYSSSVIVALMGFFPFAVAPRRQRALDIYSAEAGDFFQGRPHLIAHSFGTFLTVRLIEGIVAAKYDRMVLVGCVLSRSLNWVAIQSRSTVSAVLNDWTRHDHVPGLAQIVSWLHKGLGSAGKYGFRSDPEIVHDLSGPEHRCVVCESGNVAIVHNVDCSGYGHSDTLLVRSHATQYWLPFFWAISAEEYKRLREFCLGFYIVEATDNYHELMARETEAKEVKWKWAHGDSLWSLITRNLAQAHLPNDERHVSYGLKSFALAMGEAFQESCENSEALSNLYPHNAVRYAVISVRNLVETRA